jgi:hypothetical protein
LCVLSFKREKYCLSLFFSYIYVNPCCHFKSKSNLILMKYFWVNKTKNCHSIWFATLFSTIWFCWYLPNSDTLEGSLASDCGLWDVESNSTSLWQRKTIPWAPFFTFYAGNSQKLE